MKEIIALLWATCIAVVTLYLHTRELVNKTSASLFFVVAILGGLAIANYDIIKRFEGLGVKVETAQEEIANAKSKALSEIESEVASHKQSIEMLIRSGNDLDDKLESQKTAVNAMIEKAEALENEIEQDQKKLEAIKASVVLAHQNSEAIFNATKDLSVILARITYIQAQTKSEFGNSDRLKTAAQIIEKDINKVLNLMIPNPKERAAFIEELTTALPKR